VTAYVDSSALLKRYVREVDSAYAVDILNSDQVLVTSWITIVEVRRNLARLLSGRPLRTARQAFEADADAMALVAAGEEVCRRAAAIGEEYGVRSLDAIHLASAQILAIPNLTFVTWDLRQAQTARTLGMYVLGG
jgi:predicted nucleic acid-binding protein